MSEDNKQLAEQRPATTDKLNFIGIVTPHNIAGVLDIVMIIFLLSNWLDFQIGDSIMHCTPFELMRGAGIDISPIATLLPGGEGILNIVIVGGGILHFAALLLLAVNVFVHFLGKKDRFAILTYVATACGLVIWIAWNIIGLAVGSSFGVHVNPMAGLFIIFGALNIYICSAKGKAAMSTFWEGMDETQEHELP